MINKDEIIHPEKWQTINYFGFLFICKSPLFDLEVQLGIDVCEQLKIIGNSINKVHKPKNNF